MTTLIVVLSAIVAILALHLVKTKEGWQQTRVISNRAAEINPGFGGTLGAMQTVPGVAGITGNGGAIDYDKAAQAIIENRGTFGDLVGQLQRNWEAPYIKNLIG